MQRLFQVLVVQLITIIIIIIIGVKMALGNRGMTVEAARQCAKDRKAWRALVHM